MEWILVLSIALQDNGTSFRDISVDTHGGFTSKRTCEAAGLMIGRKVLSQAEAFRKQQGVTRNTTEGAGYPMFLFDCLQINK